MVGIALLAGCPLRSQPAGIRPPRDEPLVMRNFGRAQDIGQLSPAADLTTGWPGRSTTGAALDGLDAAKAATRAARERTSFGWRGFGGRGALLPGPQELP